MQSQNTIFQALQTNITSRHISSHHITHLTFHYTTSHEMAWLDVTYIQYVCACVDTAMQCSPMQWHAMHCNATQCTAIHCCCALLYATLDLHAIASHSITWSSGHTAGGEGKLNLNLGGGVVEGGQGQEPTTSDERSMGFLARPAPLAISPGYRQ